MYRAKVYVTYKDSILDPQAEAIKTALHQLEFPELTQLTCGKYFELELATTEAKAATTVEQMCQKLLANVNMESYRYEIVAAE
ncbi:phosphoribosylformylglycinamidine synthase subunit PurS [Loigolactobacillus zhaoyuanensis]|uniref:Phosphoribosylformylglycinamidine synthase subunit PurS n=1 Tax=Loigolactobacillus zhaoyuanensis TaxID=2486017 RepID=A0ABW8U8J2_9LACO|nr:phosphoribosylformylglycinamidine synthase subunit PurS [Loigolactobacillus zhaoyuanensis]